MIFLPSIGGDAMKMTIRKIAESAGVSRGTVDKVLHGRAGVSEEVRERVQMVIQQNGYQLPQRKSPVNAEVRVLKIAVIIPRQINPFFKQVKQGMDDAVLHQRGEQIQVSFYECDGNDPVELLSIFDYIAAQQIDGLLLRGINDRRLCQRLELMAEKEVPVVLFDSDVPGAQRLCMVGEDGRTSGRVAASLLAKSIGGKGEVAIINGHPDMAVHSARQAGFEQVMRERFPEIHIVEVINCRDQRVIAYEQTAKLIKKYPKLQGIFSVVGCTGDIGQAVMDGNRSNIKIISYNFTSDVIMLTQKGIVDFSIGLTPYRQGMTAMTTLLRYLIDGEKPASTFIEMPLLIGVDENIAVLSQNQDI